MIVHKLCKVVLALLLVSDNLVIDSYLEQFIDNIKVICVILTRSVSKVKNAELVLVKTAEELVDIAGCDIVVERLVNVLEVGVVAP